SSGVSSVRRGNRRMRAGLGDLLPETRVPVTITSLTVVASVGAAGGGWGGAGVRGQGAREGRERRGADLQLHERCPGGSGRTAGRLWPSQPQGLFGIGVRVDFADRQVPVVEHELPPAVLFTLARRLVGEQGPFHFDALRDRGR